MYSFSGVSDEDDEIIPSRNDVKRLAIIDGCNVLHACALKDFFYSSGSALNDPGERKTQAIGLMLMVKRLIEEDYDVRIFTSPLYTSPKQVENYFILEQFKMLGILSVVENNQHDDHVILNLATETGGFVISRDQYRDYSPIPELVEATRRVIPFDFSNISLDSIGGTEALGDYRNQFCFGMELTMNLDPEICVSHINRDIDFLLVHSRRRLRPKCRLSETLRRIYLIAEFLQRELCSIFCVKPPPPLPFFNKNYVIPNTFPVFLKQYDNWMRLKTNSWNNENNIFVI